MLNDLNELKVQAIAELQSIADVKALEDWRVKYLGRKGELTQILRGLVDMPIDQRKVIGSTSNDIKVLLGSELDKRQQAIKDAKLAGGVDAIDVTLPGRSVSLGRLHPTTQIVRQMCDAFSSMGFEILEGPEVESDYYNFEALNIPKDHPARDMWDTIWISRDEANPTLLRTHTSPMQVRVMEKREPPVRVVVPGRCYRYEATDATHESIFFQIEGLAVDKGITFADLKGTLYEFAKRLFGAERKVRFRCDYFPFV